MNDGRPAMAQQVLAITDPGAGPPLEDWTYPNTQGVSFTFTEGYSHGKIVTHLSGSPADEFNTTFIPANGTSPTNTQIPVPNHGNPGEHRDVDVKVIVYNTMGTGTEKSLAERWGLPAARIYERPYRIKRGVRRKN